MNRRINQAVKSLPYLNSLNGVVFEPSVMTKPIYVLPPADFKDEYESDMRFAQDFLLPWATNKYMDEVSLPNLFQIAARNKHLETRADLKEGPIVLYTATQS